MFGYANITMALTRTARHRQPRTTGDVALLSQLAAAGGAPSAIASAIGRPREAVSPTASQLACFVRRPPPGETREGEKAWFGSRWEHAARIRNGSVCARYLWSHPFFRKPVPTFRYDAASFAVRIAGRMGVIVELDQVSL